VCALTYRPCEQGQQGDQAYFRPVCAIMVKALQGVREFEEACRLGGTHRMELVLSKFPNGLDWLSTPAMMVNQSDSKGSTPLHLTASLGHLGAIRLLLDHPCAEPAAMLMRAANDGFTAFMVACRHGHFDAMFLLLDHPSADAAAMMAVRTPEGASALTAAAEFAAGVPASYCASPCVPLLLLLRRVAVEPQPCDDTQQAHMSLVMEALCTGPHSKELFDDQPDDARDECTRLLIARGATSLVGGPRSC
jgi:hypothetical protein